jgi:hypothetical protein
MGVLSLDNVAFSREPNVGFVIVRITRFASMIIVGFDPHVIEVGDLAINIIHSGLLMKETIWIKIREGVDGK